MKIEPASWEAVLAESDSLAEADSLAIAVELSRLIRPTRACEAPYSQSTGAATPRD